MTGWSLERLKAEWPNLLDREEEVFQRCVNLDTENLDKMPAKAEAVREWWSVASAILWMFVRTRTQLDHELQPFPAYTLGRLANIAEELSNGNVPRFVSDAARPGRPLFRKERHHIAYGVLYIEAVRRGEIQDRSPNKTVRQTYNVTRAAVQQWVKDRDRICVGVPHKHLSPQQLTEKMRECGATYARIGRGAPSEN